MDTITLIIIIVVGSLVLILAAAACIFFNCYVHKRHAPIRNSVKVKYIPDEVIEKIELGEVFVEKAKETKKDRVKRLRDRMMKDKASNTNAKLLDVVKAAEVIPSTTTATLTVNSSKAEKSEAEPPPAIIDNTAAAGMQPYPVTKDFNPNPNSNSITTINKKKPVTKQSAPQKGGVVKKSFSVIGASFRASLRSSFGRLSISRMSLGASIGETDELMQIRKKVIADFINKEKKDAEEGAAVAKSTRKINKQRREGRKEARSGTASPPQKGGSYGGWFGLKALLFGVKAKRQRPATFQQKSKRLVKRNIKISSSVQQVGEVVTPANDAVAGTNGAAIKDTAPQLNASIDVIAVDVDLVAATRLSTLPKSREPLTSNGEVCGPPPAVTRAVTPSTKSKSRKEKLAEKAAAAAVGGEGGISMLDDLASLNSDNNNSNANPESDSMNGTDVAEKREKREKKYVKHRRGGVSDRGDLSFNALFKTDQEEQEDDEEELLEEMGDYEKNSENMSHLIHKKKLLRDGSDLFDLDRTERRRELLAWRNDMRVKLKQSAAKRGETDTIALNSGPPPSAVPNGYRVSDVFPTALDESLCRRKIMYLVDDSSNDIHGWFYGSIAILSKRPGFNYKVKYDKGITNTRHVDGIVDTLLSFEGNQAYGRRWVLLERLNHLVRDIDDGEGTAA